MHSLTTDHEPPARDFLQRWEKSGSAERANYTLFLTELCDLLQIPRPKPTVPDDRDNAYVFERAVPMDDGDGNVTIGRIDLYKRGCFVLEAKQGSTAEDATTLFDPAADRSRRRGTAVRGTAHWDVAMKKAKGQAERSVRSLPPSEGNVPSSRLNSITERRNMAFPVGEKLRWMASLCLFSPCLLIRRACLTMPKSAIISSEMAKSLEPMTC